MGAFVSVVFLAMLYLFEAYFGMPRKTLAVFMTIATIFFVYSSIVYFVSPLRWPTYLKIIAILNICYCLFTIYHVVKHIHNLTAYGKLYFMGEVLVIALLAGYEIKIATINEPSNKNKK